MRQTFFLPAAISLVLILFTKGVQAQVPFERTAPNRFFIEFTDKNNNPWSLDNPQAFLSEKALTRRQKQGISLAPTDLPVTPAYIDSIRSTGAIVLNVSKWFNGVTVNATDSIAMLIERFPFVKKYEFLRRDVAPPVIYGGIQTVEEDAIYDYGVSGWQSEIHKGIEMHNLGYTGYGITIAQIDAGFYHVDQLPVFNNLWINNRILGSRDFVIRGSNLFEGHPHGTVVLSIMGGNLPGELVGTAPDASFWLLRSEDTGSEYPIEEDNWAAAAEFADSVGADVINTSLGYSQFDDPVLNHTYGDMDGKTTRVARAADLAFSKGIVVVVSAGNLGASPWHYISSPADADSVLTVGAIDSNGYIAGFSSRGPSSDQRIKPDVVGIGQGTWMADFTSGIRQGNGTSLSAPVITGLVACLWQSNPDATASQIVHAVRESSDRYDNPDYDYGYGIPDFTLAHVLLSHGEQGSQQEGKMLVYPNPFHNNLYLVFPSPVNDNVEVSLFDLTGKMNLRWEFPAFQGRTYIKLEDDLIGLSKGIYMLRTVTGSHTHITKLVRF